jgi:hypothetical protein
MSGNHRLMGSGDPRDSRYITDRTERLPYAKMQPSRLTRLQKTTHVVVIVFLIVLLINVIAFDVAIVLAYLQFPQIEEFLLNLRG